MNKTKHNLYKVTYVEELNELLRKLGIDLKSIVQTYITPSKPYSVLVSGSIAEGNANAESDLDLLVLIDSDVDFLPSSEDINIEYGNSLEVLFYHNGIEKNITLIFDEVQTGIGRTGEMFASQHFNVEPDILTTAKGLGAGFPMAAILCKEEYRGLETKHVSFTFGGNVMAAAAAFKTLSIIEKPEFLANVKNQGAYILSRLHEMKQHYSFIGDCRGVGLMIGFELVDEEGNENIELTHKIIDLGFDNRLLLRSSRYGSGNVIKLRPSLNITSKESTIICDRLEKIFELIHKEKQY